MFVSLAAQFRFWHYISGFKFHQMGSAAASNMAFSVTVISSPSSAKLKLNDTFACAFHKFKRGHSTTKICAISPNGSVSGSASHGVSLSFPLLPSFLVYFLSPWIELATNMSFLIELPWLKPWCFFFFSGLGFINVGSFSYISTPWNLWSKLLFILA